MISSSLQKFIELDGLSFKRDPQEKEIALTLNDDRGLTKKIFRGLLLNDKLKNDQ